MGLSMDEGKKRREPEQFSNSEYFTTHNYGLGQRKNGHGVTRDKSMHTYVPFIRAAQHHVCLIMTLQSFLGSVPSSTIRLYRSLVKAQARTKHTVMQRECGAQHSVSNLCHNYTGFSLTVDCFQLAFYSPNALLPRLFCFLHNASLSSSMNVSLSHTICLSCGSQLEPSVSLFHPEAAGLNRKENIFTPLMALCGAHCNASSICYTASKLIFFFPSLLLCYI